MKVAIAIPSHETAPFDFAVDLAGLVALTSSVMPEGSGLGIQAVKGTYVHQARQDLIDFILEQGYDYVLWLDSDMKFPRNALLRLLKHREDVVGINYAKRKIPTDWVAIKRLDNPPEKLQTTEESTGLEEVEAMGMGCVLVRTSCLAKMPDPKIVPWFQNVHLGNGRWMGEDVHFFDLLRQTGVKLYVDHDLSKECGHIGQFEYRLSHVEAQLEAVV